MFELIKKQRQVDIFWKKVIFSQKNLRECMEFHFNLQQKDFNVGLWVAETLQELNPEINKKDIKKLDIEKTFNLFLEKMFTGYFDSWEKVTSWNKNKTAMPYNAYICACCENDITKVEKLLDLTPEAINFLIDGKIYNINEQTDKWKRKNRINQDIKNTSDEERKKILEGAKYYDKMKNNKN